MIEMAASDFATWRAGAKQLIANRISPDQALWIDTLAGQDTLFDPAKLPATSAPFTVPKEFIELARTVALHRDPARWGLLYRVLFRMLHGQRHLLKIDVDDDVRTLRLMDKAVGRDIHKMRAFVRFRRIEDADGEQFIAWHRPDHYIVEANAPFFVRRFGAMRWAILTPDRSAYWDLEELRFAPGVPRSQAPAEDVLEDLWRTYYSSIFNPARVKVKAMKAEMAVRHWATLPEAQIIPSLLLNAQTRVETMVRAQPGSAAPYVPAEHNIPVLRAAANHCEGCDLFRHATQTVFGEGPPAARIVMVGEQPGDQEDLAGKPFVGPAGQMLDRALVDAGVDRSLIYVTNAVKHFKFEPRGKRRIHAKPTGVEVNACRPWLEAEIEAIQPDLVVCLGATAAQSLMGRAFRVTKDRGVFFPHARAKWIMSTIHPSALLRMPEPERREEEYRLFVQDLRLIREKVA